MTRAGLSLAHVEAVERALRLPPLGPESRGRRSTGESTRPVSGTMEVRVLPAAPPVHDHLDELALPGPYGGGW